MNVIAVLEEYKNKGERVDEVLFNLISKELYRLREALEYYADKKHYEEYFFNKYTCDVTEDEGYIARKALEGEDIA